MVNHSGAGTVTHLAPEMFRVGTRITTAVDVYAFGIMMWEVGPPLVCGCFAAKRCHQSKVQLFRISVAFLRCWLWGVRIWDHDAGGGRLRLEMAALLCLEVTRNRTVTWAAGIAKARGS